MRMRRQRPIRRTGARSGVLRLLVVLAAAAAIVVAGLGVLPAGATYSSGGSYGYDAGVRAADAAVTTGVDGAGGRGVAGVGAQPAEVRRDSGLVAPRTTPGTAIEPMWAQAPNRGFLGGWSRADTLEAVTVIDRYGGETGRFFSPQGTPLDARSLPTGAGPLNTYEVLKPLDVQGGVVAPRSGSPALAFNT